VIRVIISFTIQLYLVYILVMFPGLIENKEDCSI
jgi:hypothetical protein